MLTNSFISKTYVLAALLALMREVPFHTAMMGKDGEEVSELRWSLPDGLCNSSSSAPELSALKRYSTFFVLLYNTRISSPHVPDHAGLFPAGFISLLNTHRPLHLRSIYAWLYDYIRAPQIRSLLLLLVP